MSDEKPEPIAQEQNSSAKKSVRKKIEHDLTNSTNQDNDQSINNESAEKTADESMGRGRRSKRPSAKAKENLDDQPPEKPAVKSRRSEPPPVQPSASESATTNNKRLSLVTTKKSSSRAVILGPDEVNEVPKKNGRRSRPSLVIPLEPVIAEKEDKKEEVVEGVSKSKTAQAVEKVSDDPEVLFPGT